MTMALNDREREILGSFHGSIQPVATGIGYRISLATVAFLMVLLPIVYLGIIASVAWGWWWWLHDPAGLFSHRVRGAKDGLGTLILFLSPLVVGGVIVLFMLKPLFARSGRRSQPLTVDPEREPGLFAVVHRLCDGVGAPRPTAIQVTSEVNASASFRRGWRSFFGNDLVLTIGLPLVAAP